MTYLQYAVRLDPTKEGGFVVHFPDFEWGITQGDNEQEALEMAADVIEIYIADCVKQGKPLPIPKRRRGAKYRQLRIAALPAGQVGLVDSYETYEVLVRRYSVLARKAERSEGEVGFMRLLRVVIQDYDRRHALPADDGTPAQKLKFLMEHSSKKPADLLPIFGTRRHVNEAINGKRPISAEHARKLGEIFHVRPGLFIGA